MNGDTRGVFRNFLERVGKFMSQVKPLISQSCFVSLEMMYSDMVETMSDESLRRIKLLEEFTNLNATVDNFKRCHPMSTRTSKEQYELDQLYTQRLKVSDEAHIILRDLRNMCKNFYVKLQEVIVTLNKEHNVVLIFDSKLCRHFERNGKKEKCVCCGTQLGERLLELIKKCESRSCHMCGRCRRNLEPESPGFRGTPKPSPPPPVHCNFRYANGSVCRVNVHVMTCHGHCRRKKCDGAVLEGHQCPSCGEWPC